MKKFIYRVEHESKMIESPSHYAGPYGVSNICSSSDWRTQPQNLDSHPTPRDDAKLRESMEEQDVLRWEGEFICGFSSLKQLQKWFSPSELANLKRLGFLVVRYQAKEYLAGDTQCLFIPASIDRKIMEE